MSIIGRLSTTISNLIFLIFTQINNYLSVSKYKHSVHNNLNKYVYWYNINIIYIYTINIYNE